MEDQALKPYDGATDGLSVVQTIDGPAFKGDLGSGVNWHCPGCQAIIAEAVYPGQILNLLFRCYSCGKLSSSASRVPGQPIAGRPVRLDHGVFFVKTVDVSNKPMPVVGYEAWNSYINETEAQPTPFSAATGDRIELNGPLLREYASRAIQLLGSDYPHLLASSKKSAASRTPKKSQPRLVELISYAEEAATMLERQKPGETISLDGNKLNELRGTIEIFDRWRNHPAWPSLAKGLTTETEGPHSLMLLTAASYLSDNGNGVGIVFGKTTGRVPDLWIEPDLTQKVDIEIKTPRTFRNVWPRRLAPDEIETVITKQLDKSASTRRGQFRKNSGILAIGAFHLSTGDLGQMVSVTRKVLERQARENRKPNLVGVLLSEFGYRMIAVSNGNLTSPAFVTSLTSRFVSHPGYKGSVRIEEGLPRVQDIHSN
jgi:hypothetical protein